MDIVDFATQDDCSWYLASARGQAAGPRVVAICREIARKQATLIENTDKCIAVFQWGGDAKDMSPAEHCPIEENLCTFNAAQNGVETVFAKITKSKIAPMPLTDGGGYLARYRAKQLGHAIEGVLDDNDAEVIEEEVVMDALVSDHGAGAIRVIEGDDEVKLEHVPIEDVWFDDAEVRRRKPRSCYLVPRDGIDVYVLLEMYAGEDTRDRPGFVGTPETRRAAILRAAKKPDIWRSMATQRSAHRVDYFEAWHLASGGIEEGEEQYADEETGATKTRTVAKHDGRWVVAVEGEDGTLVDMPWCEDHFPILLYVPRPRRRSIWGLSLMRDWIGPQREYERLSKKIQNQHQKMGLSGFAAPRDAEINVREIKSGTEAAGFAYEYSGQMGVTPLTPEPVAQGTYAYHDSIPRNMVERKGISTLATASQLPAGLQQASGKALQVFDDFEDVRLMPYHRERQRWKVALSWIIICTAKRIVDRGVEYKARYRGKKGLERIDWKEVLMDRDEFVLKVFPVSELAKQPAAKFAQLNEMLDRQAITIEQFKRLFELPDLEAENELDTSDTDIIDRTLDIIVTTGRYIAPEPNDNLAMMLQRTSKFYNLCRIQEVPESRLQLLRDLQEDIKSLQQQAMAASAPPPGAGAPPMGGPAMPPGPPGMMPPAGPLPGMPPPGAPPMPMAA
jgi:hypothetical protein